MTAKAVAHSFQLGTKTLAAIATAAFLCSGVVIAPASLLSPFLGGLNSNVQYREISGTLWRGSLNGATVNGVYLGALSYRVNPVALLFGSLNAKVSAAGGAGAGKGRVEYNLFTRSVAITQANVEFNLAAIRDYSLFGITYRGRASADIEQLRFGQNGCISADAQVWTNALDASSKQLVGEGLLLDGSIACNGRKIQLALIGANSEGETQITTLVAPDMSYQVTAYVNPYRQILHDNFRQLGFEDNGDGLVYDAVGALKGVGS